jgi:hypothetical protein
MSSTTGRAARRGAYCKKTFVAAPDLWVGHKRRYQSPAGDFPERGRYAAFEEVLTRSVECMGTRLLAWRFAYPIRAASVLPNKSFVNPSDSRKIRSAGGMGLIFLFVVRPEVARRDRPFFAHGWRVWFLCDGYLTTTWLTGQYCGDTKAVARICCNLLHGRSE